MPLKEVMDPPFFARWQEVVFTSLVLVLILLPLGLSERIARQDVYATVPTKAGAFPYIQHEIFEEKSDIDVLILSTSLLWTAIDTPYLQNELSKAIGRDAKVVTLGSNWRGEDLNYVLLRDLLERRKVKSLIFSMPADYQVMDEPHNQSAHWLLYGENQEALSGLPSSQRVALYGEQVLGAPRHLLTKLRRDQPADVQYAEFLGANLVEEGFEGASFVPRNWPAPKLSPAELIYSKTSATNFGFTQKPLSTYQVHFLRLVFDLLQKHEVKVTIVHVPLWTERHKTVVEERMLWPEVFEMPMSIIGVPPATLFKGLTNEEINQFYYNEHLNANGARLFTRTITPALVRTYVENDQLR